jgi:glycosyltransferase involved in cell wall biosynthesis
LRIASILNQKLMSTKAHDKLVFNTCHSLASHGCEVTLITKDLGLEVEDLHEYYSSSQVENFGIVFIRTSFNGIKFGFFYRALSLLRLMAINRTKGFDAVYVSETKIGKLLVRSRRIHGIPVVYEFHNLGLIDKGKNDGDEAYIAGNADGVVVTTSALRDVLLSSYGREGLTEVVPLATTSTSGAGGPDYTPPDEYNIFYAGQLYRLQGVDLLVRAMAELGSYPCKLHIVGGRDDEVEELKRLSDECGVRERVVFHGYVNPNMLHDALSVADILVAPSRSSGRMPYVAHTKIYEYLSFGKPIVATGLQSVRDTLTDGFDAVLVEPDSQHSLAEGIKRIMDDPLLAGTISRNALLTSQDYTWDKRAGRLKKFFSDVVERSGHHA